MFMSCKVKKCVWVYTKYYVHTCSLVSGITCITIQEDK